MAGRMRVLALLWTLASVPGCGECKDDYDCPGSQVCSLSEGSCEAFVCGRDRDCAPGQVCRKNRCRSGPAAAPPAGPPDALVLSPPG